MRKIFILCAGIFIFLNLPAQNVIPVPVNIKRAFEKGTRSADGKPGKNYWQNHAAYKIAVDFDPATRNIKGSVVISYTNNSPDTIKEFVFKLYPNYLKKGLHG